MSEVKQLLVEMSLDYGRMGSLEGLFLVDEADFELAQKLNPQVYFGEVLGKHSEVYCDFNEMSFRVKTDDPAKIAMLKDMDMVSSGHDPFEYMHDHNADWREDGGRSITG